MFEVNSTGIDSCLNPSSGTETQLMGDQQLGDGLKGMDASLHKLQPIAIGPNPPHFVSLALKKRGQIAGEGGGGGGPSRMRVARPTRADWRDVPPSPADGLIRSLRCCGSRAS